MYWRPTSRCKPNIILLFIQNENILSFRKNKIKNYEESNENEKYYPQQDSIEYKNIYEANNNFKSIDFNHMNLNSLETESECYPGQRRPTFKSKRRININIDDIFSDIDSITKQTITEQNISLDNKKENYNTLPTKAKKLNNKDKKIFGSKIDKIKEKKYINVKIDKVNKTRNSIDTVKYINSIINNKDNFVNKVERNKNHFSTKKVTNMKNSNTINHKTHLKHAYQASSNFSYYKKTPFKINSEKMKIQKRNKTKVLLTKNNKYSPWRNSLDTLNTTNSNEKYITSIFNSSIENASYQIFENKNNSKVNQIKSIKDNKIPQNFICIKINDNNNNKDKKSGEILKHRSKTFYSKKCTNKIKIDCLKDGKENNSNQNIVNNKHKEVISKKEKNISNFEHYKKIKVKKSTNKRNEKL